MDGCFLQRHRPAAITLCALALITVALTVIAGCQSSLLAPSQVVLPFTGLADAEGVAVDTAGNLYISELSGVLKLPVVSSDQEGLPFTGLSQSRGVAVDSAGNLYLVVFMGEYRGPNGKYCVLKLPAQ